MELYVHIPFCRSKCRYCDFSSWAGCEEQYGPYIDALLKEAAMNPLHETISTAFIGGGTPSVLPPQLLRKLLDGLRQRYTFAPEA